MTENFYTYKGYPLVRSGDTIYYGYMSDPYVISINILDKKKVGDDTITSKVKVVLMSTDQSINPLDAFVKNADWECGLYEALDIAKVWLEKALKN